MCLLSFKAYSYTSVFSMRDAPSKFHDPLDRVVKMDNLIRSDLIYHMLIIL